MMDLTELHLLCSKNDLWFELTYSAPSNEWFLRVQGAAYRASDGKKEDFLYRKSGDFHSMISTIVGEIRAYYAAI